MVEFRVALPAGSSLNSTVFQNQQISPLIVSLRQTGPCEELVVRWDERAVQFAHRALLVEVARSSYPTLDLRTAELMTGARACLVWMYLQPRQGKLAADALLSCEAGLASEVKSILRQLVRAGFPLPIEGLG